MVDLLNHKAIPLLHGFLEVARGDGAEILILPPTNYHRRRPAALSSPTEYPSISEPVKLKETFDVDDLSPLLPSFRRRSLRASMLLGPALWR